MKIIKLKELQSYTKENLMQTQKRGHRNNNSATMKNTKQTQEEQRLAAQIILSKPKRTEYNNYMSNKQVHGVNKLGERRPKMMEAVEMDNVPAQRVLRTEDPATKLGEESKRASQ